MADATLLQSLLPFTDIETVKEATSTNTLARRWLLNGASSGSMVVADRQTDGRGRMGKAFCSQNGGLYMSIVLHGNHQAGEVTTLCAVAVRRAVHKLTGIELKIKWVNDLIFNEKKVCGILCEGIWLGSKQLGMVAGIGLNVCQTDFPEELKAIAVSLYPDGNSPVSREAFAAAIHQEIFSLLPAIPLHMAEYRDHCQTIGCKVCWQEGKYHREGRALSIDDEGALWIETERGSISIAAGEVSVRGVD